MYVKPMSHCTVSHRNFSLQPLYDEHHKSHALSKSGNDQQLRLVLIRPEGYNSGRFILGYDCGLSGNPTELEYRSVEINIVYSEKE